MERKRPISGKVLTIVLITPLVIALNLSMALAGPRGCPQTDKNGNETVQQPPRCRQPFMQRGRPNSNPQSGPGARSPNVSHPMPQHFPQQRFTQPRQNTAPRQWGTPQPNNQGWRNPGTPSFQTNSGRTNQAPPPLEAHPAFQNNPRPLHRPGLAQPTPRATVPAFTGGQAPDSAQPLPPAPQERNTPFAHRIKRDLPFGSQDGSSRPDIPQHTPFASQRPANQDGSPWNQGGKGIRRGRDTGAPSTWTRQAPQNNNVRNDRSWPQGRTSTSEHSFGGSNQPSEAPPSDGGSFTAEDRKFVRGLTASQRQVLNQYTPEQIRALKEDGQWDSVKQAILAGQTPPTASAAANSDNVPSPSANAAATSPVPANTQPPSDAATSDTNSNAAPAANAGTETPPADSTSSVSGGNAPADQLLPLQGNSADQQSPPPSSQQQTPAPVNNAPPASSGPAPTEEPPLPQGNSTEPQSSPPSSQPGTTQTVTNQSSTAGIADTSGTFYVQSGTGAKLTADQIRDGTFPLGTYFVESGTGRQVTQADLIGTTALQDTQPGESSPTSAPPAASAPRTPTGASPGYSSQPYLMVNSTSVPLKWDAVTGASYYNVQIRDANTSQSTFSGRVDTTSYRANLSDSKTYGWQVSACNDAGCSSYTDSLYFATPQPLASATITSGITLCGETTQTSQVSNLVTVDQDSLAKEALSCVNARFGVPLEFGVPLDMRVAGSTPPTQIGQTDWGAVCVLQNKEELAGYMRSLSSSAAHILKPNVNLNNIDSALTGLDIGVDLGRGDSYSAALKTVDAFLTIFVNVSTGGKIAVPLDAAKLVTAAATFYIYGVVTDCGHKGSTNSVNTQSAPPLPQPPVQQLPPTPPPPSSEPSAQQPPAASPVPNMPVANGPGSLSNPGPTLGTSSVTLSWGSVSGATYYGLGVRDMASNQLVVSTTVNNTSYAVSLKDTGQYRWNVAACNNTGCSDFTTPLYFMTPAAQPPAMPSVPKTPVANGPGNLSSPGPTLSATSVTLSWGSVSGATYYGLGVRDMASNQLVVSTTVNNTSYAVSLKDTGQYRWNVAACNNTGCSDFTTPLYFMTPAAQPPAMPSVPKTPVANGPGNLSSPGPTLSATSVTLSWGSVSGATYYGLGVRDMASNQLVVSTTVNNTSYAVSLKDTGQYRWNVAACNNTGCSDFTTPLYFMTPTTQPPATSMPLQVIGFNASYMATTSPYTLSLPVSGHGLSSVTKIVWTCTLPNGGACSGSPYVWTAANWSGKYVVSNDSSAVVKPTVLSGGDMRGIYNWTVTFYAGTQSVTNTFQVSY